jgi:hypothetical protein
MTGEGFAFACWVRLALSRGWIKPIRDHGWQCASCRWEWEEKKLSGLKPQAGAQAEFMSAPLKPMVWPGAGPL